MRTFDVDSRPRFQYVSCQFDALKPLKTAKKIRDALDDLPTGLDATYNRMLERINPKDQQQVARVLEWLSFSLRPLLLEEVAEVFILNWDAKVPFDEEDRLLTPGTVLDFLRGFVTEVPRRIPIDDQDHYARQATDVVEIRLAHFSIKEYLVSDRMPSSISATFAIDTIHAHVHITESCLAYHLHLSKTTIATEGLLRQYQLWEYVVKYWSKHVNLIPSDKCTQTITQGALQVFTRDSQALLNMARIRSPDEFSGGPKWETAVDRLAPPLYHACSISSLRLTEIILEADKASVIDELATHSALGFALQAAAYRGLEAIVRLLLDKGADVNAQGGEFGNALQAAALSRHEAIVQLLLDKGADVNAQGGYYGTALQAAARRETEAVVQLLLDKGADVNTKGGQFGNALQAAVCRGRWEIGELLLLRGAEVDPPGPEWEKLLAKLKGYWGDTVVNRLRKFQENPTVEVLRQIRREEEEEEERKKKERKERWKARRLRRAEAREQGLPEAGSDAEDSDLSWDLSDDSADNPDETDSLSGEKEQQEEEI